MKDKDFIPGDGSPERPLKLKEGTFITVDRRHNLHNSKGPCVQFDNDIDLYGIHGVYLRNTEEDNFLGKLIVETPEKITVKMIEDEGNAEVRRVMLERFGTERFIKESKCEVLDEAKDQFGEPMRLLRKQLPGDEDIVYLECTDSTAMPDGTKKKYLLPVHPQLKPLKTLLEDATPEEIQAAREWTEAQQPQEMTCHNAQASGFGFRGEEWGKPGQTRQGDILIIMHTGESSTTPFRES